MKVNCGKCKSLISADNVNVARDTAFCQKCENLFSLSSVLEVDASFDLHAEQKGAKFEDRGLHWIVEASHRSYYALFIVPFSVVWVGGSLGGIYGSQFSTGEFNPETSLFGLPFLIGSVILVSLSLMSVFGRTLVSVENNDALIFIGVGPIGWYRRFDWRSVSRVTEYRDNQFRVISLEGKKRLSLGWGLKGELIYYVSNVLRSKLSH